MDFQPMVSEANIPCAIYLIYSLPPQVLNGISLWYMGPFYHLQSSFVLSPYYSQNIYLSIPYYEFESGGDSILGILS